MSSILTPPFTTTIGLQHKKRPALCNFPPTRVGPTVKKLCRINVMESKGVVSSGSQDVFPISKNGSFNTIILIPEIMMILSRFLRVNHFEKVFIGLMLSSTHLYNLINNNADYWFLVAKLIFPKYNKYGFCDLKHVNSLKKIHQVIENRLRPINLYYGMVGYVHMSLFKMKDQVGPHVFYLNNCQILRIKKVKKRGGYFYVQLQVERDDYIKLKALLFDILEFEFRTGGRSSIRGTRKHNMCLPFHDQNLLSCWVLKHDTEGINVKQQKVNPYYKLFDDFTFVPQVFFSPFQKLQVKIALGYFLTCNNELLLRFVLRGCSALPLSILNA